MGVVPIWRAAGSLAARRPFLFLLVSLALAGTDIMLWRMGGYDRAAPGPGRGALAAFLLTKVALLLAWNLAALRLLEAPERPLRSALRLDGRQLRWLGGALLALALLFAVRLVLTKFAASILPEPRAALIAGLVLYLPVSLILLVRLLPAMIGVLLGDREADLGWSWRATSGRVTHSVLLILLAITPLLALHAALNLIRPGDAAGARLAILLADGPVMALAMLVAMASYRALYLSARTAGGARR